MTAIQDNLHSKRPLNLDVTQKSCDTKGSSATNEMSPTTTTETAKTPACKRVKASGSCLPMMITPNTIRNKDSTIGCACCGGTTSGSPSTTSSSSSTGVDGSGSVDDDNDGDPTPTPVTNTPLPVLTSTPKEKVCSMISNISPASTTKTNDQKNDDVVVVTPKRQGYLDWDNYFMAVAVLSSQRSKDPQNFCGACIVDPQNRIVGIGYNGFPRGCSDDVLPWATAASASSSDRNDDKGGLPFLHTQEPYMVHAITNAILNKCSHDVANCRLYVTRYPCSDCAKMILQSCITEVIVLQRGQLNDDDDNDDDNDNNNHMNAPSCGGFVQTSPSSEDAKASQILLDLGQVKVRFYQPATPSISLNFVSLLTPTTTTTEVKEVKATEMEESSSVETKQEDEEEAIRVRRLLWDEAKYDPTKSNGTGNATSTKRSDYISWELYFLAMAVLTAQRSKDPNTQVGACIVDAESRIVGVGYNGFPRGCSDDILPWARSNTNPLHNKYPYVCHAEVNAILNKGSANVKGSTIYVALFPCHNCAKVIIQAGIRRVVYMSDSYHDTEGCRASRILFGMAKVQLEQYNPDVQQIKLEFR